MPLSDGLLESWNQERNRTGVRHLMPLSDGLSESWNFEF